MCRTALCAGLLLALAGACAPSGPPATRPAASSSATFGLSGQFTVPPHALPGAGPRLGGISGLAATDVPGEFLGISDDHEQPRVYRLRTTGGGRAFQVAAVDYIRLSPPPSIASHFDPEGIARAPNGNLLIVSEGMGSAEPRLPPVVIEFSPGGAFVRALPVRDRFVPNPTGALLKGIRSNTGFESIAITASGRVFVGVESAIVQDGELATFDKGAPARIIEYVPRGGGYEPAREFVHPIEPVHRPPYDGGFAVNGLVELLALDEETLLALERSFVAEAGGTGRGMNRIRLFRIDLRGATDVSRFDSLHDVRSVRAVAKTLVLDLSRVAGLSPELAPDLDNFEAMVFGPRLAGGSRSLILASDDNFNPTQRTWFLLFQVDGLLPPLRIQ